MIFVAVPNMLENHVLLTEWLVSVSGKIQFYQTIEKRFYDFARNEIVDAFLKSRCEWLYMNDNDTIPPADILSLADYGKPIVGGLVFGFRNGELFPMAWNRSFCNQCAAYKMWRETESLLDDGTWRVGPISNQLECWDPMHEKFLPYVPSHCRCRGTGIDPWMYIMPRELITARGLFECGAVGAASLMIHRDVFKKIEKPYFRLLYKPSREVMLQEDMYFCSQAKDAGIKVHIDLNKVCRHFHTIDLNDINNLCIRSYQRGHTEGRAAYGSSLKMPENNHGWVEVQN